MGFMKYNIDFEIFGSIIMAIIIIFFKLKFDRQTSSEKSFMKLAYMVLIAQLADMATAITISIGGPKLALFNLLFNSLYFAMQFLMGLFFIEYLLVSTRGTLVRKYRLLLHGMAVTYLLFICLNLFFGFYFRFDRETGDYIHGSFYFILYIVPGLLTLNSMLLIFFHRKKFSTKQWLAVFSFIFFAVVGLLLQALVIPDIYITFGLVTISFLMILFSMETPDYRKLMQTMKELEIAHKDAEDARKEAERANRVKSDFLANMSHEIRTPINSILGFDEVILRESSDSNITGYASNIKRSGQTLLALINDILDFSKIESGKMEIIPVDYDIKDLLVDLVLMITPRAEEKKLAIHCDIDSNLPRKLHGDDIRVRQVITNLLTNAVKYTETGEVRLCVSVEKAGNPVKIKVSVKDTGKGIREEDQEELFNAFKRLDEKQNRNIEGTGLGLAITVCTLELMKSELTVRSVYGCGSEFSFVLEQGVVDNTPVGNFDAAAVMDFRNVEITHESFTAPKARILVVDDVAMNLLVFKELIKNTKIMVDTAENGMEALEMIGSADYDMVFMDHLMPGMDGIETLKKGKAEGFIKDDKLPVIALTANAISGAREMFLSAGFNDFLTKPIESSLLEETLIKYLPEEKVKLRS